MDRFKIQGGVPLRGTVAVSGSKNAALPAMAATLLTAEPVHLENLPHVHDILTMQRLLGHMGAAITVGDNSDAGAGGRTTFHSAGDVHSEAPYDLVKTMRAAFFTLGPLLGRCGEARVSLPGGCAIGARPVDLHLKALETLGATFEVKQGYVHGKAKTLRGAKIAFERITVGGTENALMAASVAKGETVIENAAREPEISDLAELLRKMGARIEGDGTSTIHIQGVEQLHGTTHRIIPDRIEAGTLFLAAAITGGELQVKNCQCDHLQALFGKLRDAGVSVTDSPDGEVTVAATEKLKAVDIRTEEYPGFPTDMQAQFMALMTQAEGSSVISEEIFENRFMHVPELARMGAAISVEGNRATVEGPAKLAGATLIASDLRASAGLVLAALVAEGETIIDRVYHIDRGYERIEEKLRGVGARIERISA